MPCPFFSVFSVPSVISRRLVPRPICLMTSPPPDTPPPIRLGNCICIVPLTTLILSSHFVYLPFPPVQSSPVQFAHAQTRPFPCGVPLIIIFLSVRRPRLCVDALVPPFYFTQCFLTVIPLYILLPPFPVLLRPVFVPSVSALPRLSPPPRMFALSK